MGTLTARNSTLTRLRNALFYECHSDFFILCSDVLQTLYTLSFYKPTDQRGLPANRPIYPLFF